jgi:hypothetical protein
MLTIVLPTYNGMPYLPMALQSVLKQTVPCELLICDDASPKQPAGIFDEAVAAGAEVLRRTKNMGLFANLNEAMTHVKTEWALFLCQDDLLRPTCVETVLEQLATTEARMLIFSHGGVTADNQPFRSSTNALFGKLFRGEETVFAPGALLPALLKYGSINSNLTGLVVHVPTFFQVGQFDASRTQVPDWELVLKFARHHPIGMSTIEIADNRDHSEQLSAVNMRSGVSTEEVAHMIKLLLAEPAISELPEAEEWALAYMESDLWIALKWSFHSREQRRALPRILRSIHTSTGLRATTWSMCAKIPHRIAVKLGITP